MTIGIGADVSATYATLTEGKTPAVGDVYDGADGKSYKFVLFNNGAGSVAAVSGSVGFYFGASGTATAASAYTVTGDATDSIGLGAGVFQSIPADGEYCWVQIKGPATLTTTLTSGADGNALCAGAADLTLKVSAAVTDSVVAFAVDASADIISCNFPR